MVRDKYLIKTEPKRKRLECRRCHQLFSYRKRNVHLEVVDVDESKKQRLITTCLLCGYKRPRILRKTKK